MLKNGLATHYLKHISNVFYKIQPFFSTIF